MREILTAAGTVVVSVLLFQFHLFFFLFLIPLYLYGQKRDTASVLLVDSLVWLVFLVQGFNLSAGIGDIGISRGKLLLMDMSFPTFLIFGHAAYRAIQGSSFNRLLAITAGVGVFGLPLILYLAADEGLSSLLREQIVLVTEILRSPLEEAENWEASVLFAELSPDAMVETTRNLFFRFFLAAYLLMQGLALLISRALRGRLFGEERFRFKDFYLPEWLIWLFIGAVAGVAFDFLMDLGAIAYPFWNIGAIMLIVYGVQGLGIIGYQMEKRPKLKRARFSLVVLYIILLFTPVVNVLALFSVPLLGVSEMWIRYREA